MAKFVTVAVTTSLVVSLSRVAVVWIALRGSQPNERPPILKALRWWT